MMTYRVTSDATGLRLDVYAGSRHVAAVSRHEWATAAELKARIARLRGALPQMEQRG